MRVSLQPKRRKIACIVVSAAVAATILYTSGKLLLASRHAAALQLDGLRAATALDPLNDVYWTQLGRYLLVTEPAAATAALQRAAALNPYRARTWLDLADAYLVNENTAEYADAIRRALEAEPKTPEVAWRAANLYVVQGDMPNALRLLKTVLDRTPAPDEHSPHEQALHLALRIAGIDEVLATAIPPRSEVAAQLLNIVVTAQDVAAARRVWQFVVDSRLQLPGKQTFPFIELLVASGEGAAAAEVWAQVCAMDPEFARHRHGDALLVNGGFDEKLMNGGFDWRLNPWAGVRFEDDTLQFHDGHRSLAVTMEGAPANIGLHQNVPVKPGQRYRLQLYMKGEMLETASGPRMEVVDTLSGERLALTDEISGTTNWLPFNATFTPSSPMVTLRLVRAPADRLIRGKFWIDAVTLGREP